MLVYVPAPAFYIRAYLKRILIISPSFPPINAADMHRVRQSLPYLRDFGRDATVMVVRPDLVDGNRDEDLLQTIPTDADVQTLRALHHHRTRLPRLRTPPP